MSFFKCEPRLEPEEPQVSDIVRPKEQAEPLEVQQLGVAQ